jgi:hypothetical protein
VNEVLDRIEGPLLAGVRYANNRRERQRRLATVAVAVTLFLLAAGAGIAAVSETAIGPLFHSDSEPIERLLNGDNQFARQPGSERIDMRLIDPGGLGWTVTGYVARNGLVSGTEAPDGLTDPLPAVGGSSGFVIADNLLNGPISGTGLSVAEHNGRYHYLFSGGVDARAVKVSIRLGPETREAQLSQQVLTLPVEMPADAQLTAEGKARARRMPREVSVRSYAATFTPNFARGEEKVRGVIEVTLGDGTTDSLELGSICVEPGCEGLRALPTR